MGSSVFKKSFRHRKTLKLSPSGFDVGVFGILNPIDPFGSMSNLYLMTPW